MVIFLYGPDSYRSRRKLEEIIDHCKNSRKSGVNLVSIDSNQLDFSDFYRTISNSGIFPEKKIIILKNLFSNQKFQEDFLQGVEKLHNLKDIIVVFEPAAVDERLKIFKVLSKNCWSQEFKLLDKNNLNQWAKKEFYGINQKINLDALNLLINYVGSDLWRASNEIKKLADFKKGTIIKKEDVELLVKPEIESDIFKTIDALAARNKKLALHFLQKHLDAGDNPLYLLSMIAYQFKNLLIIKELADKGLMYGSIIKKSGLHPFVVKKNYFACRQFSLGELKNTYHKIFNIDLDIKNGKIEPETALELLVSDI